MLTAGAVCFGLEDAVTMETFIMGSLWIGLLAMRWQSEFESNSCSALYSRQFQSERLFEILRAIFFIVMHIETFRAKQSQ